MEHGEDTDSKEHKRHLEKQCLIKCGYCHYHRNENATRRKPKPNKHKNIKRDTIRHNYD